MTVKVTMPNNSSDSVDFINTTGTILAQVKAYDDGSSNGHLELYTTASGTSTERVRVTSAGNVGIGTSSPTVYGSYKTLDVRGTGGGLLQIGTGASTAAYLFQDGTNAGFNNIANGVITLGTNNTERARIDTSGNVGIGTSSPAAPLHVSYTTESGLRLANTSGTPSDWTLQTLNSGILRFYSYTAGAERMRIDNSGIVTGTAGNLMLVSGTSVASTSGTSINFTGIPSWAKKVTVMFSGVSTNGSSNYQVQIGSGSVTTSGYLGSATASGAGSATANFTAGFGIYNNNGAANVFHGVMTLALLTGNTWVESHAVGCSNTTNSGFGGGSISLGGTLDRVRITTVNGTDTFDAGSINILWE